MAYGHSSGLPPKEAPIMIAEKHKLSLSFSEEGQQHCLCAEVHRAKDTIETQILTQVEPPRHVHLA